MIKQVLSTENTEVDASKSCIFHSIGSAKADPYRIQNIVESCRGEPWLARANTKIRYFVMMYLYSHYLLALTESTEEKPVMLKQLEISARQARGNARLDFRLRQPALCYTRQLRVATRRKGQSNGF